MHQGRLSDDVLLGWARTRLASFRGFFGTTVLVLVILPLLAWIFIFGAATVIIIGRSLWEAFHY